MNLLETEISQVQAELERRFVRSSGCIARVADFAVLFPSVTPALVEEALHRICEAGGAEMDCLADGALVYHFPPG